MKCLKVAICLFTVIQLFVTGTHALAVQDDKNAVDLSYFQENDTRGGDCVLKSSVLVKNGENLDRIISVYVQDDGKYFLSAWVKHINGQTLKVYLDDQRSPLGIMPTPKTGWQSSQLVGSGGNQKKISMTQGQHTFTFRCKGPVAPSAEYVRLAGTKADSMISDTEYQNYISRLKQGGEENAVTGMRNVISPDTPDPDIPIDYLYKLDMPFTYTTYINIYLYEGQEKVFETKKGDSDSSDPVMHLFSRSDPSSFSLTDEDSGDDSQAKITCTIPSDGWYILLLRAQGQEHGTSDVYMGSLKIDTDAPVAGSTVSCSQISKTGRMNYFTSNLEGSMADTRIWLIDSNNKVAAYNNDYQNPNGGEHTWGYASRVLKEFSTPIHYVLVSSFVPREGTCDLYMKCNTSGVPYSIVYIPGGAEFRFPNFKWEDGIRSAPASSNYDCVCWAGGITQYQVYLDDDDSPWHNSDPLTALDNFFGNHPIIRYPGSCTYSRTGADWNNSVIDLWGYKYNGWHYTHASVRKHGDRKPHGYDWESKDGWGERVFHPRDALEGGAYGSIIEHGHYKEVSCPPENQRMTFEQSEKAGLVKLEVIELSKVENDKLQALISDIPTKTRQEFHTKYTAWKNTWTEKYSLYLRKYAESEEYYDFLEFCKTHDETLPLLFELFAQREYFAIIPINDLTIDEYGYLKDEIRQEGLQNRYDENGVYLAPSPKGNAMKYIKKLSNLLY